MNPLSHTPLSINSLHSYLRLSLFKLYLLLQTLAPSLYLCLHVSCHYMCLVLLVLGIRLNILTFKFFTTSGTHNFAYGPLILLQLPLHLLILILKGKNAGSSLLTLTISGLTYFTLLIIHWNIAQQIYKFVKVDKNANPVKKIFLINPKVLYYTSFSYQILWMSKISSKSIVS